MTPNTSCPWNKNACGLHLVEWQPILDEELGVTTADYVALNDVDVNVCLAYPIDAQLGCDPLTLAIAVRVCCEVSGFCTRPVMQKKCSNVPAVSEQQRDERSRVDNTHLLCCPG